VFLAIQTWERGCRERVRLAWRYLYNPIFYLAGGEWWFVVTDAQGGAVVERVRRVRQIDDSCDAAISSVV
jgi:hypothetical protein